MSQNINFSERYNNYLAPEAMIVINGEKISDSELYFTTIEINKTIEGADTFSFSISDAINLEFEEKETKEQKIFELGEEIELYMGYANGERREADLTLMFVGLISSVNWSFSEERYLDITVEGKDYSFLLMKYVYPESIKEAPISEIVERIVKASYGQSFKKLKIEKTEVVYKQVKNKIESDYLFIQLLADKVGYEFFVDRDTLYFQSKPKEQSSELTLFYGQEILSFSPELNVEKSIAKVIVTGLILDKDKKKIVGEASLPMTAPSSEGGVQKLLKRVNGIEYKVTEAVNSVEEAKRRAEALLENFKVKSFKAELKSIGIPQLRAGITISLEGLGKRFSRDYYVEEAVHTFSEQGYETSLQLRWSL